MNNLAKTCTFIGHRKIEKTDNLNKNLTIAIEDLIVNKNVHTFLFGSRSEFNELCHLIVTTLKEKYPYIKRVFYTCQSEYCITEKDLIKWENICSTTLKKDIKLLGFEEEFEYKNKNLSGKASYVERNYAMINDSVYCVFYYNDKIDTQYKSGTKIA